jgi:hypothetical protein
MLPIHCTTAEQCLLVVVQGLLDVFEQLPEVMFSYIGGAGAGLRGPPICKRWRQLALQECSSVEVSVSSPEEASRAVALLGRKQDLKQLVSADINIGFVSTARSRPQRQQRAVLQKGNGSDSRALPAAHTPASASMALAAVCAVYCYRYHPSCSA